MSGVNGTTDPVTDDQGAGPPQRRSARLSSSPCQTDPNAAPPVEVKRKTFIMKKILPRKTNVLSEVNKETMQTPPEEIQLKKSKTSTPGPPPRRQSVRLSPSQTSMNSVPVKSSSPSQTGPNAAPPEEVKRKTFIVKKIVPRKTNVLSEANKEVPQTPGESQQKSKTSTPGSNRATRSKATPRETPVVTRLKATPPLRKTPANKENTQAPSGGRLQNKPKRSNPEPAQATPPKFTMLSPILAPSTPCLQEPTDAQDLAWSLKVRRSYTRASPGNKSFERHSGLSSPSLSRSQNRESLFGFETLQTPEVVRKRVQSNAGTSGTLCGVSKFSLLDVDAPAPVMDRFIPGVSVVKKKRVKRAPQLKLAELDVLAAKMNAEFEEAEEFDLVIE